MVLSLAEEFKEIRTEATFGWGKIMLRINRGVVILGKSILLLILTYENWSLSKMSDNALPTISFWTLFFFPSHQITAHSNTSLFSHWQLVMHIVLFLFFYADSNTCQSCFISFWQTDKKKQLSTHCITASLIKSYDSMLKEWQGGNSKQIRGSQMGEQIGTNMVV